MAKRLTKHERAVHTARVAAHNSANYARACATNGASADRLARAKAAAERDAAALAALEAAAPARLCCANCGNKLSAARAAIYIGFEDESALCTKCSREIHGL